MPWKKHEAAIVEFGPIITQIVSLELCALTVLTVKNCGHFNDNVCESSEELGG